MTSLRGTVVVSSPGAPPVRATAPGGGRVLVAPGVQGPPGHGVNLAGAVPTYADLPELTVSDAGKAFMVQDDGRLYVWSGVSWPADGAGAQFRGETGPEGRGIEVVSVDGDDLLLGMTDGSTVRASVPALAAAVDARDVAVAARADAVSARSAAESARDGAVDAAGRAEGGASEAVAARDGAVTAAGRAESAAGDAEESAGSAGESSTLSADAAAVAVAASVATMTYTGNGSPEGVVTAPPGAAYIDRVATTGGVRWIKATGTGPTGWRILWGDTGDRDIRGLFPEGHQFTLSTIRRIGDVVYLSINSWRPPADGTSQHIGLLPSGFLSSAPRNFPGVIAGSPGGRLLVSGGIVTGYSLRATADNFFSVSWTTKDPWPTTLPGVPV